MSSNSFQQDDYFKIDPELHLVGDMQPYIQFPGVQMWWKAIENIRRPLLGGATEELFAQLHPEDLAQLQPGNFTPTTDPEGALGVIDRYGVDVGCLLPESMMDTTGFSSRWVSPTGIWRKRWSATPTGSCISPISRPIKHQGVRNAIWELEHWANEKGARIFKFYPPEDTYVNDPALWPFYEKAEALGIVLDIYTGFSWVPPGKSKYALPILPSATAVKAPSSVTSAATKVRPSQRAGDDQAQSRPIRRPPSAGHRQVRFQKRHR